METIMPIRGYLPASAFFDSEVVRVLGSAFEDAWEKLKTSDGTLTDERDAASTRELLAKRIIELGRHGERDHDRLVEHAVAHLAKSRGAPDVTAGHLAGNPLN
jgi:hypothetical protein